MSTPKRDVRMMCTMIAWLSIKARRHSVFTMLMGSCCAALCGCGFSWPTRRIPEFYTAARASIQALNSRSTCRLNGQNSVACLANEEGGRGSKGCHRIVSRISYKLPPLSYRGPHLPAHVFGLSCPTQEKQHNEEYYRNIQRLPECTAVKCFLEIMVEVAT